MKEKTIEIILKTSLGVVVVFFVYQLYVVIKLLVF